MFILCFINVAHTQLYIPADPSDLLFTEQKVMMGGDDVGLLMIRPIVMPFKSDKIQWYLKIRTDAFYNDGAPNLENTSDKWVGKGFSYFTSANITFNSKYLFASMEPFVFNSQNKDYDEPERITKFMHLNDNRAHTESPYTRYGLRETQIYFKYNGFGVGWSNANMWWGPGIHTSLMMSNNTTGFGHIMIGTVNEKRIGKWGFNGRYMFSKFGDEKSFAEPYFSGFIINSSYYSNPIITLGFARSILSGGNLTNFDIDPLEAALLPFQFITVENTTDDALNPVDQTYTGYFNIRFPESNLVLFMEYGRNEGPASFKEMLIAPNHSDAFIVGLRKYGLFGNINLFGGFEYCNIAHSSFWEMIDTEDWYNNYYFDYNTYDGRNFAAHSGPDSDDFLIWLGYSNNKFTILSSFNYERHGLTHPYVEVFEEAGSLVYDKFFGQYFNIEERTIYRGVSNLPETKFEIGLDLFYFWRGFQFAIKYQYEYVLNYQFGDNRDRGLESRRNGNVLWLSIERDVSDVLSNIWN